MNRTGATFFGLAFLLTHAAGAQTAMPEPKEDLGSVYLQCDGLPPHRTAADLAARIVLIMATAGLAGPGEMADVHKRLSGSDGVAACDKAVAGENDPARKMQLMLARSVHHVEAKDYQAALDDARAAPDLAGPISNTLGFRHGLYVSALELQAAALVRLGRPVEAQEAALQMADAAPYDVVAQTRAARYVGLAAEMTPQRQAYYDRLAKIWPEGLILRYQAHEWAGRYLDGFDDITDFTALAGGFASTTSPAEPSAGLLSAQAVALALGADMTKSIAYAANARAVIDEQTQSGKALTIQSAITNAEEELDFQQVAADLAAGKGAQARAHFTARSRWSSVLPPAVADLVAKLRAGAPPADLTGTLALDPATIRSNSLTAKAGAILQATDADKLLYTAIRISLTESMYSTWTDDVWNIKNSPFLVQRKPKDTYTGDAMLVRRSNGVPAGEALLMHCALLAKARGVAGFVLFPTRQRLDMTFVRFGNPGDPGMPASAFMNADTVIAALSSEFPDPSIRRK